MNNPRRLLSIVAAIAVFASASGGELLQGAYYTEEDAAQKLVEFATTYSDLAGWNTRATTIRSGILTGSGLDPLPERTPLNPITRKRHTKEDYSVESIAFESLPGFFVTGNLYQPSPFDQGSAHPAILVVHGHGNPATGPRFSDDYQTLCQNLARLGFVVFIHDMIGYGESTQLEHKTDITLGLQLWNNIRAVDFLTGLAGVDVERVGVTGHSGGGTQTILLTAVDDRISASAPVTMVAAHFFGGCECESGMPIHRRANHETNNCEIAALAAPRPQLLVSDGDDWTKNTPRVELPYIQGVYRLFGAEKSFANAHFEKEGHDYGPSKRAAVCRFFAATFLKAVSEQDVESLEKRAIPEPRERLTVFDEQHPRPSNADGEIDSVRRFRSRAIAK